MANPNDKNRSPRFRVQNPVNGSQQHGPSSNPFRSNARSERGDHESTAANFDNASMDSELRMASSLLCDSDEFVAQVMAKTAVASLEESQPMSRYVREAIESECSEPDALQRHREYPTNIENWLAAVGIAVLVAGLVFVLSRLTMPTATDDSKMASTSQIENRSKQDWVQPINPAEKPPGIQAENSGATPLVDAVRSGDAPATLVQTDNAESRHTQLSNVEPPAQQPKFDFDARKAIAVASQFLDTLMPWDRSAEPSNEMAKTAVDFRVAWQLAVHFGGSDKAEIRVNGRKVGTVSRNNIAGALPLIGEEVKSRFQFLEHSFREPLKGVVTVDHHNFIFREARETEEAFDRAAALLASLDRHSPKRRFRSQYRFRKLVDFDPWRENRNNGLPPAVEGSVANLDRTAPQASGAELNNIVYDVVLLTERILRQSLTNKKLTYPLHDPLFLNSVADRDRYLQRITRFVSDGTLFLPEGRHARTQILHGHELIAQLKATAVPLDVFRDAIEFGDAERFIMNLRESTSYEYQQAGERISQLLNDVSKPEGEKTIGGQSARGSFESRLQKLDVTFHEVTKPEEPLRAYLARRPDLAGLPLAMGEDCRSNLSQSITMSSISSKLGRVLSQFDAFGSRPFEQVKRRENSIRAAVHSSLLSGQEIIFDRDQAFQTLEQMLQVDTYEIRMNLVNDLKNHGTAAAVRMLVDRAKFDFDPRVRSAAIKAIKELNQGDTESVRNQLMEGFDYPWHIVAEHSAEALAAFNDKQTLPELLAQLEKSDPRLPIQRDGKLIQRKLVAVNHLKNCLLCHAPANQADSLGVAVVPSWDRPMPAKYYSGNSTRGFVRADVTYLKQDFSVMQEVEDAAPWPTRQRFDYVVQERTIDAMEAEQVTAELSKLPNRNRNSVLFALRQITGKTAPVDDYKAWSKIVANALAGED